MMEAAGMADNGHSRMQEVHNGSASTTAACADAATQSN